MTIETSVGEILIFLKESKHLYTRDEASVIKMFINRFIMEVIAVETSTDSSDSNKSD